MAEIIEDMSTVKQSITRWINALLPVLARPGIRDVTHLPLSAMELLDSENRVGICHNLANFIQDLIRFLWFNAHTNNVEDCDLMRDLNLDMIQVLGEDVHPEVLALPPLNQYYNRILNNMDLRLYVAIVDQMQFEREEKERTLVYEQRASRSGHWDKAERFKRRYLRLRLSLKGKLEEFLRKFLDVETALNDQHN